MKTVGQVCVRINKIETATGRWYVRRITPYVLARGGVLGGVVVTWTDITQVKRADARARRLSAVVDDSNDAVTVFDLKGRILAWNNAAVRIYGYSESEALQMSVSDLLPPGAVQDHLDFIELAAHSEVLHSYETQRIAKDGRAVDVWMTLSTLVGAAGVVTGVASTERDLTDRGLSNAYLRERADQLSSADRRKNEFLAMLGHELRNPLAALVSAANLLTSEASNESRKRWAAGVIQRQGKAMTRLVNDLLDITRITSGSIELNRQMVQLSSIVQSAIEVCQPIINDRRHRLSVSLPAQPVYLFADSTRLSQVIENIVINAAKFTEPGGSISVRATTTAHRLCLHIKDTGRGIAPAMLGKLFEMFVQGAASRGHRNSGLGVGLSVVKRLVELHGGSVRAVSDGVNGSEFIVDIPLASPSEAVVVGDVLQSSPAGAPPKRILIIDDNTDAAEALAALLEIEGHTVKSSFDGASGLAAAISFKPDVILLDIGLPDIDGHEVSRRLRAADETRGAMLVAVTGYGLPADRIRSAEAGFDHHLTKPVDHEELARLFGTST